MISKNDLEAKNRNLYTSGEDFKLNNGAIVALPSIPIGKKSKIFLRLRDELQKPKYRKDDSGNNVLVDGKPAENPEYIDPNSEKGFEHMGKILHEIITLNYDLTPEQSEGLFSISEFELVYTWFYTGKTVKEFRDEKRMEANARQMMVAGVATAEPTNGSGGARPTDSAATIPSIQPVANAGVVGVGAGAVNTGSEISKAKTQELIR